jgi:hypothetical protein
MSKVIKSVTNIFTGSIQKKEAKRAERLAQQEKLARDRLASAQAARERTKQLREARIQRASIQAQGAGMGIGLEGSSAVTGSLGSLSSQMSSNIAAVNMQQTAGEVIGNLQTAQASAMNKIQAADRSDAGIMNIFNMGMSIYGGMK